MNINISDFFKNNITNNSSDMSTNMSNIAKALSGDNNVTNNTTLNMLLKGDTFTGLVSNIKDNMASVILGDGSMVNAKLSEGVNIAAGQTVTFMVTDNEANKISIKPILADEQQSMLIGKVLDGAALGATEKNINVVKELMNLGMPIDSKTVSEMVKATQKFPEANINTLANLKRLDIPITEKNIEQFEAYKSFDNQMSSELTTFANDFINIMSTSSEKPEVLNTFNEIVNTLYDGLDNSEGSLVKVENAFSEEQISHFSEMLKEATGEEVKPETLKNMSLKELANNILKPGNSGINPEGLEKLAKSEDFKDLMKGIINETMKLTPKSVQESDDAINSFYKRIKKNVDNVDDLIKKDVNLAETSINKSSENIKNNIDFMNDLNKNLTFVQMPIKFSESEGNGELYVFTNKKSLANKTDSVSALLHLDMENLGPMDVFVKMAANNVSTNFVLESEELLDFVYSHIDKLNSRLEALGYNAHFEMKVANESRDGFDFVKDFVEKDTKSVSNGQFMLDLKA